MNYSTYNWFVHIQLHIHRLSWKNNSDILFVLPFQLNFICPFNQCAIPELQQYYNLTLQKAKQLMLLSLQQGMMMLVNFRKQQLFVPPNNMNLQLLNILSEWVLSPGCYLIETASTINILFSIRVEIGLSNGIQYQSYIFSQGTKHKSQCQAFSSTMSRKRRNHPKPIYSIVMRQLPFNHTVSSASHIHFTLMDSAEAPFQYYCQQRGMIIFPSNTQVSWCHCFIEEKTKKHST